jgi:hypothetical protein
LAASVLYSKTNANIRTTKLADFTMITAELA